MNHLLKQISYDKQLRHFFRVQRSLKISAEVV